MCRFYRWLYQIFPVTFFRSRIIAGHMAECERCRRLIEFDVDFGRMLRLPPDVRGGASLWPQIKSGIKQPQASLSSAGFLRSNKSSYFVQWAFSAALLLTVLGSAYFVLHDFQPASSMLNPKSGESIRIRISFAEVEGKRARAHVYQTPEISFVWFSKPEENGG